MFERDWVPRRSDSPPLALAPPRYAGLSDDTPSSENNDEARSTPNADI